VAAQPEVEALLQYQTIRAQAVALHTSLGNSTPRSQAIMEEVGEFQVVAGVVGQGGTRTGLYGPATQQALQFFLPAGMTAPPAWPGIGAGTWTPPAWVREAQGLPATPGPVPQKPSYAWLWGLAAATVGLTALGVALSRRSTKELTEREMVYASPWLYAQKKGRRQTIYERTQPSAATMEELRLQTHADRAGHSARNPVPRPPRLPESLFKPSRLPAAPTSKLLGY